MEKFQASKYDHRTLSPTKCLVNETQQNFISEDRCMPLAQRTPLIHKTDAADDLNRDLDPVANGSGDKRN